MNRRTLLGRLAAVVGVAALAPSVATAEASEAPCADCARLFDREVVLPAMFARPSPEGLESARRAIHARAMLGDVSHDEVAQWVYWQGFPSYRHEPQTESRAYGDPSGVSIHWLNDALTVTGEATFRDGLTIRNRDTTGAHMRVLTFREMQSALT